MRANSNWQNVSPRLIECSAKTATGTLGRKSVSSRDSAEITYLVYHQYADGWRRDEIARQKSSLHVHVPVYQGAKRMQRPGMRLATEG
jgi:hypothetical protein